MRVVVAEKPSVARDLARVLGASSKRDGFFEGNGLRITWCIGHLVELEEPAAYDPRWKPWRLDTLPMLPGAFKPDVPAPAPVRARASTSASVKRDCGSAAVASRNARIANRSCPTCATRVPSSRTSTSQ